MEQKEVLIIVGVLVVGFFLLNNNGMLSGRAVNKAILTGPNQGDFNIDPTVESDAFGDGSALGVGAGGSGEICGMTTYPITCKGSGSFGCYPIRDRPIDRSDCRYDPYFCGRSLEDAKDGALEGCQNCVANINGQVAQQGRYCNVFCRINYPGCGPVMFYGPGSMEPCSEPSCNTYVCNSGSGPGTCESHAYGTVQCLCVLGAPIET